MEFYRNSTKDPVTACLYERSCEEDCYLPANYLLYGGESDMESSKETHILKLFYSLPVSDAEKCWRRRKVQVDGTVLAGTETTA